MDGEDGGIRLSKRFNDGKAVQNGGGGGEVDYKTKAGTAWSHSYLNQKPWHPLSYPNQRRKWIAEQTHAQHQRRAQEVSREYAQEQDFFRQTALISKKDKEKIETMQAVSFMYVRPPGYNAESAKAAEIADEKKRQEHDNPSQLLTTTEATSSSIPSESLPSSDCPAGEINKRRPKDVFGRHIPTEEEFQALKNAPRLETGIPARVKPFGIEVRNVKCLRCGNYGHQSGDRECPLKDAIMPNEESRLIRDDPLTAIMSHINPGEPLMWELKQKPGISPPRGGFNPDDPNQQIVPEDIFDEYGGFLSNGNVPELLMHYTGSKPRKKSKKKRHKRESSRRREMEDAEESDSSFLPKNGERRSKAERKKEEKKMHLHRFESSPYDDLEHDRHSKRSRHKHSDSSANSDANRDHMSKNNRPKHQCSSEDSDSNSHHNRNKYRQKYCHSSEDKGYIGHHGSKTSRRKHSCSSDRHGGSGRGGHKRYYPHSSDDSDTGEQRKSRHGSRHGHGHRDRYSDSVG